jgi:FAD:protein FMN transferase
MIAETRIVMGMPVTLSTINLYARELIVSVFDWFHEVDRRFSLFRQDSEISRFNRHELNLSELSSDMRDVLSWAELTRQQTTGFFNVASPAGHCDPTGIVKGWAIKRASKIFDARGIRNYCINAGGDIQSSGLNGDGEPWRVGIRSPFRSNQIVKVLTTGGAGIATSGTYERGQHIWNPYAPDETLDDVASITVVASDILEADRFATAAFAMGKSGVYFIEGIPGLEAYQINAVGVATQTSNFEKYVNS